MKVFLSPAIALHSPAMVRIQNALIKYIPPHHQVINNREEADLCVFYPISYEWTHYLNECLDRGQEYTLIQCCYKSSGAGFEMWKPWWEKSIVVWSYLDLDLLEGKMFVGNEIPFYHAPLGIDEAFLLPTVTNPKRDYIVTTGTVHGGGQEAILECWQAAKECTMSVVHVGQWPVGIGESLRYYHNVTLASGVTDRTLRGIYQNAKYICSLRCVEGFELPALEALSCGTRSIVFTQPATTKWFWGLADFVPECEGKELIDHLVAKFEAPYEPISQSTIEEVRSRFDWGLLAWRFWSIVEEELKQRGKGRG